jgi:hypothetical protein
MLKVNRGITLHSQRFVKRNRLDFILCKRENYYTTEIILKSNKTGIMLKRLDRSCWMPLFFQLLKVDIQYLEFLPAYKIKMPPF